MRSQTSSSAAPSTVIRDVVLVDGTGEHRRHGAVRITGDKITAVGQLQVRPGEVIVEGGGLVLAPGFIDSHSHHDTNFFDQRDVVAATSQGVTTIVVGQDGFSQVPLSAFFARLELTPVAVNVAAYSGHNTLRAAVMNETEKQLPASKAQLRRMSQLLQEDMDAGALGLSTGLGYESGIHADFGEIANLAATAARNGGRYISHIRNENQRLSESIEEAIDIGRHTRAPVQISHIKIGSRNSWGQAASILNRLDEARRAGIQITADVYPYTYWQTTMRILFNGGSLDDRERIASAFAQIIPPSMLYILRYEPDKSVEGKTVETLARERGEDPVSLYIDLAKRAAAYESANASASRPVESIIGTAMSEADIETFLRWGHSNICSDGMDGGHPRGYGAFARVLGRYVRERGVLTLEQAIAKMTRSTAQHIGLEQRGVIAVGAHADLVLLDPSTVADRASIDSPTRRAVGIHRVWVNGTVVYHHGTATGSYPGAVIRRKS